MIDFAQSNLAGLIVAAVIVSALLGVAASEGGQRENAQIQRAIDGIAFAIAVADCSASHPESVVPISSALGGPQDGIGSLVLMPDHLRAVRGGEPVIRSVQFPALSLAQPLELLRARALRITFDSMEERCTASLTAA